MSVRLFNRFKEDLSLNKEDTQERVMQNNIEKDEKTKLCCNPQFSLIPLLVSTLNGPFTSDKL